MKTVLDLARQAGWTGPEDNLAYIAMLERFAKLVLAHNPPQSFISWQEGFEAGKQLEREACAKVVEASPSYDWHRFACEAAAAIRARGENK